MKPLLLHVLCPTPIFLASQTTKIPRRSSKCTARQFNLTPVGPAISEVRSRTPYAQALEISRHKTVGYSAQQAEAEYQRRGGSLVVRVRLHCNLNDVMTVKPAKDDGSQPNIAPRPLDFWKDFRFLLPQDGEPLQYRNISGGPQFSLGEGMSDGTFLSLAC